MNMKRVLIGFVVAATALTAVPAGAQVYPDRIAIKAKALASLTAYQRRDDGREEQVERTTKTFRLGPSGSLTLGNIAGDITVTRANGSDTTVEIVKTARGRDAADARELLQLVTIDASERNGRAEVRAQYPAGDEMRRRNRRNVNVSVAYTVAAPAGTRVTAESISGSIWITDLRGDASATTITSSGRRVCASTDASEASSQRVWSEQEITTASVGGTQRPRARSQAS